MNADDVPRRPTHSLQGDDPLWIHANFAGHQPLELGKGHVADGIAAGHKRADASNEGGKYRPRITHRIGHTTSQYLGHGFQRSCASTGIEKHLHHGYRENKCNGGSQSGFDGITPSTVVSRSIHPVQEKSDG